MSDADAPYSLSQFVPFLRAAANAIRAMGNPDEDARHAALHAGLELGAEPFAGALAAIAYQLGGDRLDEFMNELEAGAAPEMRDDEPRT